MMCGDCNWQMESWKKQEVVQAAQGAKLEDATNCVLCDCGREADILILNDDSTLGICDNCIKSKVIAKEEQ